MCRFISQFHPALTGLFLFSGWPTDGIDLLAVDDGIFRVPGASHPCLPAALGVSRSGSLNGPANPDVFLYLPRRRHKNLFDVHADGGLKDGESNRIGPCSLVWFP